MNRETIVKLCIVVGFLLAFICVSEVTALASDGGDLPWNTGLEKLTKALSGKMALFISMVGIFFAGGMLLFGGDLGNFGKMIMMVVLVGCMMGGLASVVGAFISTGSMLL